MAISTFSDLKAKAAKWLSRSGQDSQIEDAIALFEASYNSGEKSYFQEGVATIPTIANTETVSLPQDFYGFVSLSTPSRDPIKLVTMEYMRGNNTAGVGRPTITAIYPGNKLALNPTPAGAYNLELIYKQKVPSLTSDAPTNWLLQRWPHLYLYGTLMFMLDQIQDAERAITIKQQYQLFMQQVQSNSWTEKLAPAATMRTGAGAP